MILNECLQRISATEGTQDKMLLFAFFLASKHKAHLWGHEEAIDSHRYQKKHN